MRKDLEIRHCRILIALSEHGGVASAARSLGMAQSTVSESVFALERLVGAPITTRRRGMEASLTATAQALIPYARTLVSASEAALAVVAADVRATVRFGTIESVSSFLLPNALRRFRARHPNVEVQVTVGLCGDLQRSVRGGELDAALTMEGPESETDDEWAHELGTTRLCLVASPPSGTAATPISRSDLTSRIFLLPDPGGVVRDLMGKWMAFSGREVRFESAGSIDGVKRGLVGSDAIGVLPEYSVRNELSASSIVELETLERLPEVRLNLIANPRYARQHALRDLISEIAENGYADAIDRARERAV